jgi:type II secretory pathway pseudopilin PulG
MPSSHIQNQRGVTLVVVLVIVVILGLSLGIAGSTWRTVVQQAKEKELLFRGDQYRRAIGSYYKMVHGGTKAAFPTRLQDLLKDPRSPQTLRHIRKLYKDPMTGEDWVLIRQGGTVGGTVTASAGTGGIIGVRSSSDLEPFKKDGFSEEDEKLKDKEKYSQWEFVYEPSASTTPPATKAPPGTTTSPATTSPATTPPATTPPAGAAPPAEEGNEAGE